MRIAGMVFVAIIAVLHAYIAWFEMFAWVERGPRVFANFPPELFEQTVDMAANQGIYNAFLAAGLFWSLGIRNREWQANVAICFLLFVAVAGIVGAMTVSPRILMIQTVPAAVGLVLVYLGSRSSRTA